jgi:hypothetical protein
MVKKWNGNTYRVYYPATNETLLINANAEAGARYAAAYQLRGIYGEVDADDLTVEFAYSTYIPES